MLYLLCQHPFITVIKAMVVSSLSAYDVCSSSFFFRFDPFNIILCHIHLKSSRLDRNSPFIEFMTMCFYLGALVCVLQETGGVGGGQQPDRGDLPDPAATANHLFPPSPPLADQRLCQSGTESHTIRHRSSCIITVPRLFICVCVVR